MSSLPPSASTSAVRPRICCSPRSLLQRQTPGPLEPLRRRPPRGGLALADHADAVSCRRHDRRRRARQLHRTNATATPVSTRGDIDSGAVILTGEAIKRRNARAIDELFAAEAGKFVCATAGHKLECTLAAHGSGAVRLSRERGDCVLHVDIGGGTTKLALIDNGDDPRRRARSRSAGGCSRRTTSGAWTPRRRFGARWSPRSWASQPTPRRSPIRRVARRDRAAARRHCCRLHSRRRPLDALGTIAAAHGAAAAHSRAGRRITFSGGVVGIYFRPRGSEFGDIARPLATALRAELQRRSTLPVIDPGERIRATVIGASQFTVQVSGKTIYLPRPERAAAAQRPGRPCGLDLAGAIDGDAIAAAIAAGLARQRSRSRSARWRSRSSGTAIRDYRDCRGRPRDRGRGRAATAQPQPAAAADDRRRHRQDDRPHPARGTRPVRRLVSIDGVDLQELDFVDVGELITPPGVIPLVIKSLLFS